jgi:hypothetical protein
VAIYHCNIKIISRGKGKSSVAAAAYRAAEKIKNGYDGRTSDYTHKRGVIYKEIMLPENAPPEYKDRAVLWNAVEQIEKASNSQLAREIEIALPKELDPIMNFLLAKKYVKEQFTDKGMCADICVHDNKTGNPHAHIMLTMRPFNGDGTWGDKQKKEYALDRNGEKIYDPKKRQYRCKSIPTVDWNERTKAEEWRAAWADTVNGYFERRKIDTRIDHRSYKRQGVDIIPTVHLGVAVHQMERRGIRTERGNINREIEVTNKRLRQIKARINKLQKWFETEAVNMKPPTLYDIVSEILNRDDRHALTNLREGAKILSFLQQNKIADLKGLEDTLRSMIDKQLDVSNKLKPVNRRLETLDEHIKQSGNFKQYRSYKVQYEKLYAEYKTLKKSSGFMAKRKAEKARVAANEYYETYRPQITLYNTAEQYLKAVLQARFDPKKLPPVKKWKAEQAELLSQKAVLNSDYKTLKEETREAEVMRKTVERMIRAERPKQRAREQGMEI